MSNQDQQHSEGSPSGADVVALLPGAPLCFIPFVVLSGVVCLAVCEGAAPCDCIVCPFCFQVRK